MTQNIIAITIVALIIGYSVYKFARKKNNKNGKCNKNCGC